MNVETRGEWMMKKSEQTMRTFRCAMALSALVPPLLAVTGPSAQATSESPAVCSISVVVDVSPGFTFHPAVLHYFMTGSLDCVGQVKGASVSGPGTFRAAGTLRGVLGGGATCAAETGSGMASITIPTTAGVVEMTEPQSSLRIGLNGTMRTRSFSGVHQTVPLVGLLRNCATAPVTKAAIVFTGVLRT